MQLLEQTITTVEIAKSMGVTHKNILQKLEGSNRNGKHVQGILETLSRLNFQPTDFFIESSYEDVQGKSRKCYNCTRKGCEFLAHKFTGKKGMQFTACYIERFHDMEQALQQSTQPQLSQKEAYLLKNSKSWFQQNNWKMKMICECFDWERKYLYHKILSELSDIYNLDVIEQMYIKANGHRPRYKMNLVDYYRPLQETTDRYINYLLEETEE